jgi:hypothetical protein
MTKIAITRPRAITMWEFSWIERRWPGAGYEDWDRALDELTERGYDAVRIDAFPHLVSADPDRLWTIRSDGQDGDWGAPADVDIHVTDTLLDFIGRCRDHGVAVGLSTWYKQDPDDTRMRIRTAEDQARIWLDTLGHIERAGLLDALLYVDLCNEFPNAKWAPYLYGSDQATPEPLTSERLKGWMRDSIAILKRAYPDLDYTYSMSDQFESWDRQDVTMLDFLEPHIWMSHPVTSSYYADIGYTFRNRNFQAIVRKGKEHYFANKDRFDALLVAWIERAASWSRSTGKPLVTTECWALVNFRDWPMLEWGWLMDICALGTETAARTGRWTALATSNFCGPQYRGMWRDIAWHRRLTDLIKAAPLDPELRRL